MRKAVCIICSVIYGVLVSLMISCILYSFAMSASPYIESSLSRLGDLFLSIILLSAVTVIATFILNFKMILPIEDNQAGALIVAEIIITVATAIPSFVLWNAVFNFLTK